MPPSTFLPILLPALGSPVSTSINLRVPVNSTHDTIRFTAAVIPDGELQDMQTFFEGMPRDPYLAHAVRFRRFGMYRLDDLTVPENIVYESNVFMQSAEYNDLVKDGRLALVRRYEPLAPGFMASDAMQRIIRTCAASMVEMGADRGVAYQFGIHAIRTVAPGTPTPEGVHRDGYAFVMSVVVSRRGIAGGHSRLHTGKYDAELIDIPMHPGDALIINDDSVFHSVGDISLASDHEEGEAAYRDVLVIVARPKAMAPPDVELDGLEGVKESAAPTEAVPTPAVD